MRSASRAQRSRTRWATSTSAGIGAPHRRVPGHQFLLADLASELAPCEAWLWHVARLVDGGAQDFGVEASMLKLRASDLAMRIATEAVQLHGGYGYCKDYRVERLMRDAKITQIWEGTNQIHRQLIGRSFVRK
jgi:acyl-CoA dehydrogenase